MQRRPYRLGQRQAAVDHTAEVILAAARELLTASPPAAVSVAAVARRAGVSRITIYNRFGSRSRLLEAAAPPPVGPEPAGDDPREDLRRHLYSRAAGWAAAPSLYRHLPPSASAADDAAVRHLVERLATADALRPGASLKEAEDVIGALGSFAVFDRLHKDGRRSAAAVGEILVRLVSVTLG